ncbi:MAG: methylenetetrahydrofolate reductase [Spirochaetales bacterium]|nr:methylenetetrahydrofolate reductase [Spirochaetales bacterium]
MSTTIFDKHLIELVAPKQDSQDLEMDFSKFTDRYTLFLENDKVVCITDNPLGHLSFMAPEIIDFLELPVKADNLIVHLNTFHRKTDEPCDPSREQNEQDLDVLLRHALTLGVKYLLCVSGDGCRRFPRLRPEDLGCDPETIRTVTSVQLMEYIQKRYPGRFTCGVAFNQYEPAKDEMEKLERKLEAGASFVITQPVAVNGESDGRIATANENLERMLKFAGGHDLQAILAAWMSKKLSCLIPECVGYDIDFGDFDPWDNLKGLRRLYPGCKLYISMIFGPQTLRRAEETL